MDELPAEVIELILAQSELSIQDILYFRITCSRFKDIVDTSSFLWRKKYLKLLPTFGKHFRDDFTKWQEETKYFYQVKQKNMQMLSSMSARFYNKSDLCAVDLEEWKQFAFETPRTYEYITLELYKLVNLKISVSSLDVLPASTPGSLTLKYYAIKVLKFLKHIKLSAEWKEFMSLPEEYHILERGATFVSQWCTPHLDIKWQDVSAGLDEIAQMIKDHLRALNPYHPLFSMSSEEEERLKTQNIRESLFNKFHCQQVIDSIRFVLYQQLKFHGNEAAYYEADNSFINKVLENRSGLPITLAVIFESVARRVGLKCEPINFPAHFLLRYTSGGVPSVSYYIDVFNNGEMLNQSSCPRAASNGEIKEKWLPGASLKQVVERMANNLEVYIRQHTYLNGYPIPLITILELQQLLNPKNIATAVHLARHCMQHNLDAKPLIQNLLDIFKIPEETLSGNSELSLIPGHVKRILRMLSDYQTHRQQNEMLFLTQTQPKSRPPQVAFAVGMIMKHLSLNYICVIYDWDPICKATPEWQNEMGVNKLKYKHEQPFYNVIVEDGTRRYVAQENLLTTLDPKNYLCNDSIGKYFSHSLGNIFVPNQEKEKEYPLDGEVRKRCYIQHPSSEETSQ